MTGQFCDIFFIICIDKSAVIWDKTPKLHTTDGFSVIGKLEALFPDCILIRLFHAKLYWPQKKITFNLFYSPKEECSFIVGKNSLRVTAGSHSTLEKSPWPALWSCHPITKKNTFLQVTKSACVTLKSVYGCQEEFLSMSLGLAGRGYNVRPSVWCWRPKLF